MITINNTILYRKQDSQKQISQIISSKFCQTELVIQDNTL